MATTTKEMLARIDERTLEIEKKLDEFASSLGKVTQTMDALRENVNKEIFSVKEKMNEHDIALYGRNGREGLAHKVERHDRAFWKTVGIGGFLMLALEFLKGWVK